MTSSRDVYKIGSAIGSKYRNVAQITRNQRRSFKSSFSLPCVSSAILRFHAFLLQHFLSILSRVFLMMSNRDVYKIGSTIDCKYRNVAQSSFSLPCVISAILRFHAFLLQHFLSILPRVFLMTSNRDVYRIGSTIGSKYRNVAQITRIMRRSFESSFSLPCVSSTILRM